MPLSTVISTSGRCAQREVDDRRRQAVAVHARGRARRSAACSAPRAEHAPGRAAPRRRRWRRRSRSRRRCRCAARRRSRRPAARRPRRAPCSVGRRQQARQAVVELVGAAHAARGEQARQQRVHAGLLQRPGGARRHVAQRVESCGAFTAPPAPVRRGARRQRRAQALPEPLRGAASKRCARRSPHSVSVTGSPRAARAAAPRAARRRARCQASAQAAQSSRQRGRAQAVVDLRRRAPRVGAGSAPQPLSQNELTGSAPRASRASLTGCVYSSICTSLCRRRSARAVRALGQPAVDVAADHAVERRGGQLGQRSMRDSTSAAARPSAARSLRSSNSRRTASNSARDSRLVERQRVGIGQRHVVACPHASAPASAGPRRARRVGTPSRCAASAAHGRRPSPRGQPQRRASARSCGVDSECSSPPSRRTCVSSRASSVRDAAATGLQAHGGRPRTDAAAKGTIKCMRRDYRCRRGRRCNAATACLLASPPMNWPYELADSAGATRAPAAPGGATASSPSSPACRCSASRSAWRR